MITIKKIHDVVSGTVTIDLPEDFQGKTVEITILPIEESGDKQKLASLLLKAPRITKSELEKYNRVRDWMCQWHVKEF